MTVLLILLLPLALFFGVAAWTMPKVVSHGDR